MATSSLISEVFRKLCYLLTTWAHPWSSEVAAEQGGTSRLFTGAADFAVDNSTFVEAQIRSAFYPKFENNKSDQETRKRMIEMVSRGLATMEVTLKHSGSLFMYAGHRGAYAKNSFGNIYTAVGVFVLDRMFHEAWGKEAPQMQAEFNEYLQKKRINISMELVTAVLGDHGQRPKDDYAVVTAVTELGHGKPKFYSTPDVIAFCQKWRLSTNHVWLFSTRESATSFFGAYDALCEDGTATSVCKALDKIADISVPGSKDHIMVQGEILEGLVARIVSHQSSDQMKEVLRSLSQAPLHEVGSDLGPSLREICASDRSDDKQKIKALLENVRSSMCPDHSDWVLNSSLDAQSPNYESLVTYFLEAHPTDYATKKLQEMIGLMKQRHIPATFKCYLNYENVDNLHYKMVIHVRKDSVFRRYQKEMRKNQGLWPLYRGFFIDINLFKANNKKAAELSKNSNTSLEIIDGALDSSSSTKDGLAGEDSSLMVKLKFLNYKIRTFLIRDGLSALFKEDGIYAYQTYYLRQMKNWGTSAHKMEELCELLDQWAVYIRGKCGNKPLSSSEYLTEAEPFLEQYAKHSPANQALVGAAGVLVQEENLGDGEDDLQPELGAAPSSPTMSLDVVYKTEVLGDNRPLHSLTDDLIGERYWQKVADRRKKEPFRITIADKNAPDEKVWRQVPFEVAVEVVEKLKAVAKGDTKTPDTAKQRFGKIMFAAVTLSQADILGLVRKVAEKDTDVNNFLNGINLEDNLMKVHVTLAHKRAHGVAAVASYSAYRNKKVPVSFNTFFYNDKMAALGGQLGMVNGETIISKNDWPHCTLWTVGGVAPKEANTLPQLVSEGKAKQVLIDSPITISGVVNFY